MTDEPKKTDAEAEAEFYADLLCTTGDGKLTAEELKSEDEKKTQ